MTAKKCSALSLKEKEWTSLFSAFLIGKDYLLAAFKITLPTYKTGPSAEGNEERGNR